MEFDRQERFPSPTGATLNLYSSEPRGRPRGIVHVQHGLAEHAGRYAEFAAFLAARGYHVIAHDHRGHGLTQAPEAPQGRFAARDGARKVIADAMAVAERHRAMWPDLPLIIFGHSMGGLIAMNLARRMAPCPAGLAVWNAHFNDGWRGRLARLLLRFERMRRGSDVPSPLMNAVTFEAWGKSVKGHRTAFDWLSRDEEEVAAYLADPLCGFSPTVSLWLDLFDFIFDGASPDNLARLPATLPIHIVGGSRDPATDCGRAVLALARRLRRAGLVDVTGRVYPGLRHETLKERQPDRRGAMEDFAAWLSRLGKILPPPSLR